MDSKHIIPIEMDKVYNRGNCYISASGLLFDMVRHPCCNVCVCFRKTNNFDQNDVQTFSKERSVGQILLKMKVGRYLCH